MTGAEIDALTASLRDQADQRGRLVDLGPILTLVNAEVRVSRRLPPPQRIDGVFYRQLDGLCIRGRRKYYIYINGNMTVWTRRRFTIAHEIGHVVMHDAECSLFSSAPHLQDTPEIEANEFAARLLIPTSTLRHDLCQSLPLSVMARQYGVSPQAMERAIRERGEGD